MPNYLDIFNVEGDTNSIEFKENILNNNLQHVSLAKEVKSKLKYKKALKRKLKKYKLRRDGEEDRDVLDVSQSFKVTLNIRSPNKQIICDFVRPDNYLIKMVKRKQSLKNDKSNLDGVESRDHVVLTNSSSSQDKKQTNAFQLLMDGRNKSIGCNSPGKERIEDDSPVAELVEKRDNKAKRILVLQKMADAKGALKRKEKEELEDECIRNKMEIRAERLKAMITYPLSKKCNEKNDKVSDAAKKASTGQKKDSKSPDVKKDKTLKSFSIIDMFDNIEDKIIASPKKNTLKEDEEFLKKLSPSIKKKENMLSYFQKVDKDSDIKKGEQQDENESQLIIKVKFTPKRKLKKKSRFKTSDVENKSLTTEITIPDDKPVNSNSENKKDIEVDVITVDKNLIKEVDTTSLTHIASENTDKSSKNNKHIVKKEARKRKHNINNSVPTEVITDDSRPKRTVRKPVKYYNELFLMSSDEELHTAKKPKKQVESNNLTKSKDKTIVRTRSLPKTKMPDTSRNIKGNVKNKNNNLKEEKHIAQSKKPLKLAPIFNTKSQSSEEIEAKLKFLQSGVPEQLKKIVVHNKNNEVISNAFTTVVHVQQYIKVNNSVPLLYEVCDDNPVVDEGHISNSPLKKILNLDLADSKIIPTYTKSSIRETLRSIKESYPKFPVYRTYHSLRGKSKGDLKESNLDLDNSIEVINHIPDLKSESPDKLMWTDKYKPLTTSQIIGNFESVKELRKWLVTWTENNDKFKGSNGNDSDSSDFYVSDTDSKEGMKPSKNLLIITGPTGSGKTSAVYAVAAELAIKVIEVNASSRRTGKIMLQDLQEATQSHKVNRGKGSSHENSQKSQSQDLFNIQSKIVRKKGRKKKDFESQKSKVSLSQEGTSSQESTRTCMSLILIDDADVVFDQDDGFCSAISQLVHCSKRPVILITQSLSCSHLQRFLQGGKVIKTNALVPRMLGTWLDIMCLADNGNCWPGMGAKVLDHFKGDIRKTINYLQYYMSTKVSTEETCMSQNSDVFKSNIEDECSSMSWSDKDYVEEKVTVDNKIRQIFLNEYHRLPMDEFDIWWSLPNLYNNMTSYNKESDKGDSKLSTDLTKIAKALDSFSICDYLGKSAPKSRTDIASHPWCTPVADSVIESENMENFDFSSGINIDICRELVKSSVLQLRRICNDDTGMELEPPTMMDYRKRERIINHHNSLTSFLSPSAMLDRRALALDYWSSCRAICRTEKNKSDNNSRRNNRFCHYLRTQNVSCRSESFDELCDSLQPSSDSS